MLVPSPAAEQSGLAATLDAGDLEAWLAAADAAFEAPLLAAQAELVGVPLSSALDTGQLGVGRLRLDPFVVTTEPEGSGQRLAVLVTSPRGNTGWEPDGDVDALLGVLAERVHPSFATAELRCTEPPRT